MRIILLSTVCAAALFAGCNSQPGHVSGSFTMGSSDQYLHVPLDSSLRTTFTYEFWAKAEEEDEIERTDYQLRPKGYSGQHFVIFPKNPGWNDLGTGISLGTNGVSLFEHKANYMQPRIVYTGDLKGWHHYAVVYDRNISRLFVDGVNVGQGAPLKYDVVPYFSIGEVFGANKPFKGEIDEFRLWSKALTDQEIMAAKDSEADVEDPSLALYYTFGDGDDQPVVPDQTHNRADAVKAVYKAPVQLQENSQWSKDGYSLRSEPLPIDTADKYMSFTVDHFWEDDDAINITGWAFNLDKRNDSIDHYIVLRGLKMTYFYYAEPVMRPDLTQNMGRPLDEAGFQARIRRTDLFAGEYSIYILIRKKSYYNMHETDFSVTIE